MKELRTASILSLFFLAFQNRYESQGAAAACFFVKTRGTHFVMNGGPFYMNGFNAYWLMNAASEASEREKVTSAFQEASSLGMNVARTCAFNDGGYRPLQYRPGSYNEEIFKGLDFVISEARKYGVCLILSLVNNYEDFGGREQYVEWARDAGQFLSSEDDFYTNPLVKSYYKNHVKVILSRINTLTGLAYKDDPTILAWELINEPRCPSDLSGTTLQNWIAEMAAHVKYIDGKHLLVVGLEGFYGESMPEKKQSNPGYQIGTDFITNHQIPEIDFATIHAYPDIWFSGSSEEVQINFLENWLEVHIQDSDSILKKPLLITEFGKSSKVPGYFIEQRDAVLANVYSAIYSSARSGGSSAGGLFWQLLLQGMDNLRDGYEVVIPESPSTACIISEQSQKLLSLNGTK